MSTILNLWLTIRILSPILVTVGDLPLSNLRIKEIFMNTAISKLTTKELTLIGLMTAVTCILGPLSFPIPFSPVPISFTILALLLSLYILGTRHAFISYVVYFLLGLAGLPVFSGFSGGMGKVAGPTGGYLIGFFLLIPIAGFFIDKWPGKKHLTVAGMVLGVVVCNTFGTVWLSHLLGISFTAGLASGVIPYIPGDLAKIIIAAVIGPVLHKAVRRV